MTRRYEEDGEEDATPEPSPAVHDPLAPPGTASHPAPSDAAAEAKPATDEDEFYEDEGVRPDACRCLRGQRLGRQSTLPLVNTLALCISAAIPTLATAARGQQYIPTMCRRGGRERLWSGAG